MGRTVGTALCLIGVVIVAMTPTTAQQTAADRSHGGRFHRQGARAIPNHYIVVLDRDAAGRQDAAASIDLNDRDIADLMPDWAGTVTRRFDHALNGFTAQMTEQQAEQLSDDPRVAFVEEDSVVETLVTQSTPPPASAGRTRSSAAAPSSASMRSVTDRTRTIATATARMSPGRLADRPTASPRASACSPS